MKLLEDVLRFREIKPEDIVTPKTTRKGLIAETLYPVDRVTGDLVWVRHPEGPIPISSTHLRKIQRPLGYDVEQTKTIVLTASELHIACIIADFRAEANTKNDLAGRYGAELGDPELDYVGVPGEMAVAKMLGKYWSPEFKTKQPVDILPDIQVRSTEHHGYLILHPTDADAERFVKIFKEGNTCTAMGWLPAHKGKLETYWGDIFHKNRPAYFIPDEDLYPMEFLL